MPDSKLSPAQVAQLGGLRIAQKLGSAGMARLGRKGGRATAKKLGREHYVRAAHARWGRLKAQDQTRRSPRPVAD